MRQLMRSEIGPWEIIISIFVFMLVCAIPADCQTTIVGATVIDQAGTVWANGTWKLDFVPNPNYPSNNINWNGNPFPTTQWSYSGTLNGSGIFSASGIPSNNFITPVGSTYTLSVCPNATSACSVITSLTIQGSTLNLSSTITASTPAPSVKPLPLARAYNDAEVLVNPTLVGYFYQNVTSNSPRYWDGSTWQPFVNGVTTFHAGNLVPLFTTAIGADPTNPVLAFTLSAALSNTVFGNCTGSTANPSFCSLTPTMIPTLPYVPSSTNFFYQFINSNGATQTQRPALNFSSKFAITDSNSPPRTNVDLANSGVSAGTVNCANVTVDISGRVTNLTAGNCVVGHDYYFNYTGCTITNGSNLNNCQDVKTWSGVGLGSATVVGTDYLGCIVNTGNTYTASWNLGVTGITSSGFTSYWTEIMANVDTSSSPTIKCHLHTAA